MKISWLVVLFICCILTSCSQGSQRGRKFHAKKEKREIPSLPAKKKVQLPDSGIKNDDHDSNRVLQPTDIFKRCNPAVFVIYTTNGYSTMQGSGFFISPNGLAVSNYHVFKGTTKGDECIKLTDGTKYKVKEVVAYSEEEDYIVFQVDADKRFSYLPICNRKPLVGEKVYAIGSPRGYENTFSSGEISQIRSDDIIQISVPIDHGSSGGALINSTGEVMGITSGGRDDSGANLNYAINIKVVREGIGW